MASMIEEILAQIPAEDLAAQLGTDPDTAMEAARKALPALLGGLSSNVSAGGGDALGNAVLRDHMGSLLEDPNLLQSLDADDGQKILGHIFGDQKDQVVDKLGATSRAGSSLFSKLLPLLAPLVMAWLGKKMLGAFTGGAAQADTGLAGSQGSSSGGLGGLLGGLGGLFGGGSDSAPTTNQSLPTTESSSSGGLGGLLGGLGGLLGGGGGNEPSASQSLPTQGSSSAGGLGGLLGGLLGREVEDGRSSMPDIADLFDILGGGASEGDAGSNQL